MDSATIEGSHTMYVSSELKRYVFFLAMPYEPHMKAQRRALRRKFRFFIKKILSNRYFSEICLRRIIQTHIKKLHPIYQKKWNTPEHKKLLNF